MLSRKENLLATIKGENPDRFVQQYEAFVIFTENPLHVPWAQPGGGPVKDAWGITQEWREGQIGQFPIHDEEHIVCKDIEHWQEYVHAPKIEDFTRKDWQFLIDEVEKVDRSDQFVLPMIFLPRRDARAHQLHRRLRAAHGRAVVRVRAARRRLPP